MQTRRYPSLASHERPGDSLRRDEKTTISDRTRRDGQRFARRVRACMSWYTMIYDDIGLAPSPGLIEAKVQRVLLLASHHRVGSRFLPAYMSRLSVCSAQVLVLYSSPTPVYEHHLDSRQVYSTSVLPHHYCYGTTQGEYLLLYNTSTEQSPSRTWICDIDISMGACVQR